MKPGITLATALAATVVAAASPWGGVAHADLRSFTHTYEYSTTPAGNTALQLWHTQTRATTAANSPQLYEGVLEIEHGVTEHLELGFYTVLEQLSGDAMTSESLHLSRVELEGRYRISERGELPIDTELFLELAKSFGTSRYEVEGMVIGARDFGELTLAANAGAQIVAGRDVVDTELELGWAAGATYLAHPRVRIGVETWGLYAQDTAHVDVGPALSFAPTAGLWAAVTAGFAVTERDAVVAPWHGAFSARAIIGIEL